MNQPTAPIAWATDANYPAGGNPWNGQPTKVAPLAGAQAAGLAPKDNPPAQTINYMFWLVWQWIAYLASFVQPYVHQAADFFNASPGIMGDTYAFQGSPQPATATPYWFLNVPSGQTLWLYSPMQYAKVGLKIATIDFYVRSQTAGKTVKLTFVKQDNLGVAAIVLHTSVTHACVGGSGAWEKVTIAPNYEIEAGFHYRIDVLGQDTVQFMQATVNPA